jgi:TonB family protein
MLLRCILLISALLIGAFTLAQEASPSVRHIPDSIHASPETGNIGEFVIVDAIPEFPGGDIAMYKFLATHVNYPKEAQEKKIQGVVYVKFLVKEDGSVDDARVLRGIGGGCDEEALRVVERMPDWTPGRQGGKPVRVEFSLPVRFTMAD